MHFRVRNRVIQVVRTTYDPATKKPKALVLGSINKDAPEISDELRLSCLGDELPEVRAYLKNLNLRSRIEMEMAARSLAEQMRKAAEWFDTAVDNLENESLATEITRQMPVLRKKLQRLTELSDSAGAGKRVRNDGPSNGA